MRRPPDKYEYSVGSSGGRICGGLRNHRTACEEQSFQIRPPLACLLA